MLLSLRRYLFNSLGDLLPSSCFAWRRFALRLMGVKVHKTARVNAGFRLYGSGSADIAANAWLGRNCRLYTIGNSKITIGHNCELGPETILNCQSHQPGPAEHRAGDCIIHDISVGSGSWIGTRSTILCGRIGAGAIVGAGAVVLDDIADNTLAAGVPATEKKRLG